MMVDTIAQMKAISVGIEDPALKQSVAKIQQDRDEMADKSLCETCRYRPCNHISTADAERGTAVLRCVYYASS